MSDDEQKALSPDIKGYEYLVSLWVDCGRCDTSGMQYAPLRWSDIEAYSRLFKLDAWECSVIASMSKGYVLGLNMSESIHPPTVEILDQDQIRQMKRDRVNAQLKKLKVTKATK